MFTLFNSFPKSYFQGGPSQSAEKTPIAPQISNISYKGIKAEAYTVPDSLKNPSILTKERQEEIKSVAKRIIESVPPMNREQIVSTIKNELLPKNPDQIISFFDIIKSTMTNEITQIKNNENISKEERAVAVYNTIKKYTEMQVTALRTMVDTGDQNTYT